MSFLNNSTCNSFLPHVRMSAIARTIVATIATMIVMVAGTLLLWPLAISLSTWSRYCLLLCPSSTVLSWDTSQKTGLHADVKSTRWWKISVIGVCERKNETLGRVTSLEWRCPILVTDQQHASNGTLVKRGQEKGLYLARSVDCFRQSKQYFGVKLRTTTC